ncbi:MAG: hypothetical protein JSS61_00090 [Verrucomicrobia bacterium]|nr:hypothetical protein [Verrucomicrobiota bacterium]
MLISTDHVKMGASSLAVGGLSVAAASTATLTTVCVLLALSYSVPPVGIAFTVLMGLGGLAIAGISITTAIQADRCFKKHIPPHPNRETPPLKLPDSIPASNILNWATPPHLENKAPFNRAQITEKSMIDEFVDYLVDRDNPLFEDMGDSREEIIELYRR